MSEARWFFSSDRERDVIHCQARFEGDDGIVGDAYRTLEPGGWLDNLSYDQLRAAGAGSALLQADGVTWVIED